MEGLPEMAASPRKRGPKGPHSGYAYDAERHLRYLASRKAAVIDQDGRVFASSEEAAAAYDLSPNGVRYRARVRTGGWRYAAHGR